MGNLHPARNERPELSERELTYITLHTQFTRKQINEFFIRFFSYYPRGSIDLEEFSQLYSHELKHLTNSRPLLERLFHHIDTDKDGRLNFKEVLFFKAITMPESDLDEKFRWIFLFYDTNEDGQIDRREFSNLCHLAYDIHGKTLTKIRLRELNILFDQFDIDHDQRLNCDEFIQLCQHCSDLLDLITPMFRNTKWSKTNQLPSDRLEVLMKRTKFTREQIFSYHQAFLQRCPSGRLSKGDFINFYQKLLPSNTSETYCEFLFRAFDNLHPDGFIQFDEYLLAIYIHSNASTAREKLEWLHQAYDRNGDGFISYEEINQIVHALFVLHGIDREKHSAAYFAYQIMAILDLNNDDKISKQEFLHMLKDKELTSFLAPSLGKQQS